MDFPHFAFPDFTDLGKPLRIAFRARRRDRPGQQVTLA
jgi:hypothetical protein